MPELESMLDQEFPEIYPDLGAKTYYVYAHCYPQRLQAKHNLKHLLLALRFPHLEYLPFYIGKGTGNRWQKLNRNDSHRKIRGVVRQAGKEIIPVILSSGLSENKALELESKLIDILGLSSICKDGLLVNLDEGIDHNSRRMSYSATRAKDILRKNGFKLASL